MSYFGSSVRIAAFSIGLSMATVSAVADDHYVDFDDRVDFSAIKTFTIQDGKVASSRPELNNSLVLKKIKDAIRASLVSKGLAETTGRPDVVVDFSVDGLDYTIGPGGRASPIGPNRGERGARGQRGGENAQQSSQPVEFTEGTLVIDVIRAEPRALIWRGVYRDNEKNSAKLAEKLSGDATKLLSEYSTKKIK